MVGFVIGCSFTFEHALLAEGIALRHVARGRNVAMYRTGLQTVPAGPFSGPWWCRCARCARPMRSARCRSPRAFRPCTRAPVHLGDPALIGIRDIGRSEYGDAVEVMPDELPVFWACGVTPQAALAAARLPLAITACAGARCWSPTCRTTGLAAL